MLKNKLIKRINSLALQVLFCSYALSCFAGKTQLTESELAQQQNYISNSLNAFFETQPKSKKTTVNHIFSPYSLEGCLVTYGKTQNPHSIAKNKLDNQLIQLGINPDMPLSSVKKSKLQLLTAMLTRDEVTQEGHDKLTSENIFLGEYLLQDDSNNNNIANRRQVFKEEIQSALAKKFNGSLNLDYQTFWSPAISSSSYLKVVSAIKFQDAWEYDEPFENIGLNTFYTKDNKQQQVEFIEKIVDGAPVIDNNSNWQAIRIFYKHKYAIDIILPTESDQSATVDKKQIICSLISQLNENKINNIQDTNIIMPKFEHKQKNCLDSYTYKILEGIKPNYRGFLVDYDHSRLLTIDQDCYIKIDEKGTTAEAITDMDAADGGNPVKDFLVNRSYFFVLSKYQKINNGNNSPFKIKNIIMIGEVGNPSE